MNLGCVPSKHRRDVSTYRFSMSVQFASFALSLRNARLLTGGQFAYWEHGLQKFSNR